jgi:hypothetical protein
MAKARPITQSEWGRIIAHAWLDPKFADQLSKEPAMAVRNFLKLDADAVVHVFEVPPMPGDLTKAQLSDISSGKADRLIMHPFFSC